MESGSGNKPVDPKPSQLDYSQLQLPDYQNTRVNSAPLSPLDFAKFKVGCKLKRRSMSSNAQQALTAYVLRWWADDEQRLVVEANRLGISPEELFNRLAGVDGEES